MRRTFNIPEDILMAIAVFCFGTAACQASEYPQTSEKAAPLFGTLWGLEQIDSYNQTFSPANEPLDSDYLETGIDYTVQFITELDGKLLCEIKTICGNCVGPDPSPQIHPKA